MGRNGDRAPAPSASRPVDAGSLFVDTFADVQSMLAAVARREATAPQLARALTALSDEAHARGLRAEQMVIALKQAWRGVHRPGLIAPKDWDAVYELALTTVLDIYFGETPR